MKIRILLLTLICAMATVPGVRAADGKAKGGDKEEETELGNQMDKMGGAFRKLKRQVADASKNEDSLKLVATIKAASAESVKLTPAWKPEQKEKYQAKMKEFNGSVAKLEAALKAGKNDEAAKICEELGAAQKEGHKEFKKPDAKKK
jgi:uncharacterized protein YukE